MKKDELKRANELESLITRTECGIEKMNTEHPCMVFKMKTEEKIRDSLFDFYSDFRDLECALEEYDVKELVDFMIMCGEQFQERILRMSKGSLGAFKKEFEEL